MAHHDLREDTECQNCGHTVEHAYCSKCGQHNIETRQSFVHLIQHMFEDITHYDGNFWRTIKYLLFRPGKLTTEYLLGHRMRYVPPVRLYIFISFITFFLMAIMAPGEDVRLLEEETNVNVNVKNKSGKSVAEYGTHEFESVKELDSVQNSLPETEKMPTLIYCVNKAFLKSNDKEISLRDIIISTAHTVPKILFLYMPVFALWLWLFHGKKRWYFFDHGIFTLHYFSFLLLLITIYLLLGWGLSYIVTEDIIDTGSLVAFIICSIYSIFYFFRSHRKFYGETRAISRLKSLALFIINYVCIMITIFFAWLYIILNIH